MFPGSALLGRVRAFRPSRLLLLTGAVLALGVAALAAGPVPVLRPSAPSWQLLSAEGQLLRARLTDAQTWHLPVTLEAVHPRYVDMLLAYEDRRFYWHPGVDPLAVVRAAGQWLRNGHVVSGASTLTMQVSRLVDPRPRTLGGKALEAWRALRIGWHHDKRTVLEAYLNLAPFGGNLQGVRAASLAYFGKEPAHLTDAEAALLVVLPQSPTRLRPDRHPQAARVARDKVLARMAALGVLSAQAVREAMETPVPESRRSLPVHAAHLADRLYRPDAPSRRTQTTLEAPLQRRIEALASGQLPRLEPAANLAVLVVRNADRAVLAYLGGADYFAAGRAAQVDLVRAIRSPGSTLKPFVYGMALDDGLIHPDTVIDDVPTRFGAYMPANFELRYLGQVTVSAALQRSLNVPAVRVLEHVGPARFAGRMRAAGIALDFPPGSQPGLPVVLGGVGTTLEDLVTAFAGLAEGGDVRPLRYAPDAPLEASKPLMSQAAAWQITRILEGAPPPPEVVATRYRRDGVPLAFKTGTAYGFRDAWAVGYTRDHTVGVWVGRPDGSPSPGRYGRNTAAPILWRVFDLLPPSVSAAAGTPPASVLTGGGPPAPALRHLARPAAALADRQGPVIRFPPDGATLVWRDGESLPLAAEGGRAPLRWVIDGQPRRGSGLGRSLRWEPAGQGAAEVMVMDADGRIARSRVWLADGVMAAIRR